SQQSRGPSEGYSYPVCTTCGRRDPGECRRAAGTCFKCGQAGHLQKECKKNTTASTSGQADKKPGASSRVFAITEDHATKTSEHHATIDCRSYRVIFGDIHTPEFIYHGSLLGKSMQIISALQARTLMSHGCKGFLATIHDTTSDVPSIHDQPIKEDSEIWTIVENLDKQVEFCLDDDNGLWQGTRLCVPNDARLRETLLTEAHSS
nr:reverse transcriptase domain-containing protein [Tanacetum cinerariifolium]